MDPRTKKEFVADFDYEFDEKHKTVSVTEQGVAKAERFLRIDHLYRAENGHLVNHLHQALKAEALYKRDVDYAVIDGEVKIIDEFTGRILEGRRWSEGLHQAVEAKEGVRVQEENQTLATITLQNYFRMYDKLAGHDRHRADRGDRVHEDLRAAGRPDPDQRADGPRRLQRPGLQDQGRQVGGRRQRDRGRATQAGQPVLVGTISVEVSELLSERADASKGITHAVLNAKPEHAEREGETIAEAGRAGRGHDRDQHGRPRRRHQARRQRRAPRQPRGRQARPAAGRCRTTTSTTRRCCPAIEARDRGRSASRCSRPAACTSSAPSATSRGGSTTSCAAAPAARATPASRASSSPPRTTSCACSPATGSTRSSTGSAATDDEGNEEPIEAGMLSKQIEKAQKKVEEQHFLMRKHTLEYDDVLNQQREVIYTYRDEVLEGRDMSRQAPARRSSNVIERLVDRVHGRRLRRGLGHRRAAAARSRRSSTPSDELAIDRPPRIDREELTLGSRRRRSAQYDRREEELGEELMRELERFLLLADHRPALARAPVRHGLPARGHPPARVRPDRAAGRLQERGLRPVPGPDEQHLERLRAADLPRRGDAARTRTADRRSRRASRPSPARELVDRRRPRQLLGRQRARSPGALAMAAAAGGAVEGYAEAEETSRMPVGRAAPRRRDPSRSAATTRAGAGRARSTRSATARSALG